MPTLIDNDDLNNLLKAYKALPFYKRIFYPSTLSKALKTFEMNKSLDSAYDVYLAFDSKTRPFQRSLFSSLRSFSKSWFTRIFTELNQAGLLADKMENPDFFNTVIFVRDKKLKQL